MVEHVLGASAVRAAVATCRMGFLPGLEGLRGAAILLVLVHHLGGEFPGAALRRFSELGWCGVDLFFVLSGFLITGTLLDGRGSENYFRAFYARRVLRIFPLFCVFLVGFALLTSFRGATPTWSYWLYLTNWVPYAEQDRRLYHLWSLAVEEQFYLVWPLVVWRGAARRVAWFALALVAVAVATRASLAPSSWLRYEITPARLDGFALGALGCVVVRDPAWRRAAGRCWTPAGAVAGVLLVALVATTHELGPLGSHMAVAGFALLAVLFASLVVGVALAPAGSTPWLRILESRMLRSFGRYSYAIYLLHFPFAAVLREHVRGRPPAAYLAAMLTAIAASWAA